MALGEAFARPDFGGWLVWNVTRPKTATFAGSRAVQTSNPTLNGTGAGFLATAIVANVDHGLLHNLLLNGNVIYESEACQGITRTDNVFVAGRVQIPGKQNLNRGGFYSYPQRNSNLASQSYAQSIFTLRLSTQF